MSSRAAIRTVGLGKRYRLGATTGLHRYRTLREDLTGLLGRRRSSEDERTLWALRDVSIEVPEGEIVGIIGRNGAGKSTLLKLLSRITRPSEGRIEVRGRFGALLEVGTGFHQELSGRENIYLNGAVLGMSRREITRKMDEIVEFAGVERFLETPVKRYSSGMFLRLAFAVAAHLEPEVLLIDEVLAVGDADFQRKCLGRMAEIGASGRTVLFVSHNMPALLRLCPRLILIDKGRVVADGPAADVARLYQTSGLGTAAARAWDGPEQAPGDDVARLRSVRVVDESDQIAAEVDIRRPVGVEVTYWHLARDPRLRPVVTLQFLNEDGVVLFTSMDFNDREWWRSTRQRGTVRSTCWIPGNFLAEGAVSVQVTIATYNPNADHVLEPDVVLFHVVDRSTGDGVRGDFANDWPGLVRPMLDWTVEFEPTSLGADDADPVSTTDRPR